MSDPRKHGYLSNRAGQQAANEKELRDEISRLRAKLERAHNGLAFAKSVIKSGEPWTDVCEDVIGGPLRELEPGDVDGD